MITAPPVREFIRDVIVWTMGFNQDAQAEAFVTKANPAACPTCDTAHYLFVVSSDGYACLACSGRLK